MENNQPSASAISSTSPHTWTSKQTTTPSISSASSRSKWCAPSRSQALTSRNLSKNHIYGTTTQALHPSSASASRTTRTGAGKSGRNEQGERKKKKRMHRCLRARCFCLRRKQGRLCDRSTSRMHLRGCRVTGRTTAVRVCGIGVEASCTRESVLSRLARAIWF